MSENRKDLSRRDLLKSAGSSAPVRFLQELPATLAADEVKPDAAPAASQPAASAAGQPVRTGRSARLASRCRFFRSAACSIFPKTN